MNDLIPQTRLEGQILIDDKDIYAKSVDVDALRRNVGMVFQRPNPFPKSIYENVAYGLRVNAYELKIDSDMEDFIALYNPVAIDLRFSLAMLNICNNLERLGDYAEGIARFVLRNDVDEKTRGIIREMRLPQMYELVKGMYECVYKALRDRDIDAAKSVLGKDDEIDALNHSSLDRLTYYATAHPESVRLCLEISALFRKLERAGDHINNLAEQTVYYIDAEVLKHRTNKETL